MKIQNSQFLSLEQIQNQYLGQTAAGKTADRTGKTSFQEMLEKVSDTALQNSSLTFSKHAASRLNDRNIELTASQLTRLNEGSKKAGEKGIKDSLVLVDSLAFIVNVPSNTVVTAMDQNETKDKIFTNIDGAVIM